MRKETSALPSVSCVEIPFTVIRLANNALVETLSNHRCWLGEKGAKHLKDAVVSLADAVEAIKEHAERNQNFTR